MTYLVTYCDAIDNRVKKLVTTGEHAGMARRRFMRLQPHALILQIEPYVWRAPAGLAPVCPDVDSRRAHVDTFRPRLDRFGGYVACATL